MRQNYLSHFKQGKKHSNKDSTTLTPSTPGVSLPCVVRRHVWKSSAKRGGASGFLPFWIHDTGATLFDSARPELSSDDIWKEFFFFDIFNILGSLFGRSDRPFSPFFRSVWLVTVFSRWKEQTTFRKQEKGLTRTLLATLFHPGPCTALAFSSLPCWTRWRSVRVRQW